jgi:two-component system chemotaxis sensor kinase CheA
LGKEIQLVAEGEETELDKTVMERLSDPMVHMIRNCIDHGIENPEERLAEGKPRAGIIRLSAVHAGSHVHISIADDGRGLDLGAIREKAVAHGLLAPEASPSDQELYAMIFQAGFSTAKKVTSVSGRGVGMDVVRRSIEDLSGQIELKSTWKKGTTITLKLPLTLAIVEGLLVEVHSDLFILPLSIVKECVELPRGDRLKGNGGNILNVRGEAVPYISLRDYYERPEPHPDFEYVVIVESDSQRVGLVVDAVLGQHQTVIKALGAMYRDIKGVSGATIMGDGTVALIIDVPAVLANVQSEYPQP